MGKFVSITIVILSVIIVSCDSVQIRIRNGGFIYNYGKEVELNLWEKILQEENEKLSEPLNLALLEITESHSVEICENVFTCFGEHIYIYKFFKQGENVFLETEYKSPYIQTNKDSIKKKYQLEVSHICKISHITKTVYAYNDYIKNYDTPPYFSTTIEQLNVIDYENENIVKETSFQGPHGFYFHNKINEIITLIEPIR